LPLFPGTGKLADSHNFAISARICRFVPPWGQSNLMLTTTKTYQAKPGEIEPNWLLVDATDKVVGRLATKIAMRLMGKHRPTYTPHVESGDVVVVVNAEKIRLTGNKWENKEYRWYTGYPGQKTETVGSRFEKEPDVILTEAVRRMLPKNKLATKMLARLKVYAGPDHPHQAQNPEAVDLS